MPSDMRRVFRRNSCGQGRSPSRHREGKYRQKYLPIAISLPQFGQNAGIIGYDSLSRPSNPARSQRSESQKANETGCLTDSRSEP